MTSPLRTQRRAMEEDQANEESHVVLPTDSLTVGEMIYQDLDPLDSRKVALNLFEVYCHEMLSTKYVERRAFLINEMRYLICRLICRQYDYGRLYNRTIIANIVSRVCGRHAYEMPKETEGSGKTYQLPDCLVHFTPNRWNKVIVQFESLRENLLRNDASLIVLPSKIDSEKGGSEDNESDELVPEADEDINEELESHKYFSEVYTDMLDWMKFHSCLSHLQPQLQSAIEKGFEDGQESVVIPHDNIIAFESAIDEHFGGEDNNYADILSKLLDVNKKISRSTRYGGRHLKSFAEIRHIISGHKREFDLGNFQRKFLQLIRRWTALALPVPELARLNYGSTDDTTNDTNKHTAKNDDKENVLAPIPDTAISWGRATSGGQNQPKQMRKKDGRQSPTAEPVAFENADNDDLVSSSQEESDNSAIPMKILKRKREAFMENVKDPLASCVKAAESARANKQDVPKRESHSSDEDEKMIKSPSMRSKKKKKYQLKFDSSDDEDSNGSEDEGLSEIPTKYKSPQREEIPRPIYVSQKRVGRRKFTQQEDNAIISGVRKFGAGRWSDIKSYYANDLKNRSAVQIKDRWRTLNK